MHKVKETPHKDCTYNSIAELMQYVYVFIPKLNRLVDFCMARFSPLVKAKLFLHEFETFLLISVNLKNCQVRN